MNVPGFDLTPDKPAPCRTPVDGLAEQVSFLTAVVSEEPSMTRTEFGPDTDINLLVKRHGFPEPSGFPTGTADYDVDHQGLLHAIADAREAFAKLPEPIRARYNDWAEVLAADPTELTALVTPAPVTPEKPPAPAGQAPTPEPSPSPQ